MRPLADAFTFTLGVSRFGIHLESKGFAAALFHVGGLDGVLLVKAASMLITIGVLLVAAYRYPRLLVWGGAVATAFGLLGFITNTATIVHLSQATPL